MARRIIDPADIPASPTFDFERSLWQQGLVSVAGLDEAGRGAWSGPVSAAAVIFPASMPLAEKMLLTRLAGVRDSKEMSAQARAERAGVIRSQALAWGVGFASNEEIDAYGIVAATRLAMTRALAACAAAPLHLLIDALRLPGVELPQTALIKGDARSMSIAAASVLAKTARDALMVELDAQFPGYEFARHKGYGTALHRAALERLGACPAHRFSFAPLQKYKVSSQ